MFHSGYVEKIEEKNANVREKNKESINLSKNSPMLKEVKSTKFYVGKFWTWVNWFVDEKNTLSYYYFSLVLFLSLQ